MRVALFCNHDLTTNLIFAPLFDLPEVEIAGVFFAANVSKKHRTMLGGALAMLRKMALRYWLYLMASNGAFVLFEQLTLWAKRSPRYGHLASLRRLAQLRGIPCMAVRNFNDPEFIAYMRQLHVDMLIIRVGTILSADMLTVPADETWCVHSSLLPAFKGIAGEFHSLRTADAPIGSTVFRVTPELDEGPPLAQVTITRDETCSVFNHMLRNNMAAGALLCQMLRDRIKGDKITYALPGKTLEPSYFSWPNSTQVTAAKKQGIRLMTFLEWTKLLFQALRISSTPLLPHESIQP